MELSQQQNGTHTFELSPKERGWVLLLLISGPEIMHWQHLGNLATPF